MSLSRQSVTPAISSRVTEKKRSQNSLFIAFWITLSLLMFFIEVIKLEYLRSSCSLVIYHSQFSKIILDFMMMNITCWWWSLIIIVWKWPCVVVAAVCYTGYLLSCDWKEKKSKLAIYCFLNYVISTNVFHRSYKVRISQKFLLACNLSFAFFKDHFGFQDDEYYLLMMILDHHCLKMTMCCCRGSLLQWLSLLVKPKIKEVKTRNLLLFDWCYLY